jgi:hypothetical protein
LLYLTNLGENAIDQIDRQGVLTRLGQDDRIIWSEGFHIAPTGWMYTGINQLNRSPLFTGGKEQGQPPDLMLRVWLGSR